MDLPFLRRPLNISDGPTASRSKRAFRANRDHRAIKKLTHFMLGFKAFYLTNATLADIETAHIQKGRCRELGIRTTARLWL